MPSSLPAFRARLWFSFSAIIASASLTEPYVPEMVTSRSLVEGSILERSLILMVTRADCWMSTRFWPLRPRMAPTSSSFRYSVSAARACDSTDLAADERGGSTTPWLVASCSVVSMYAGNCSCRDSVLSTSATARSTWSRAPEMLMVRSGSLGVSSLSDCTRMLAPESAMKSRTVWPLCPMSRPHRRRESASLISSSLSSLPRAPGVLALPTAESRATFSRIRNTAVSTECSDPDSSSTRSDVPG
mmetsp:Transcript_37394/g.94353  ORF Transcript_37394/g.94353 Transcript_37394/m.94353 type:complete len:245 (+) Transcript_37394:651-1385(+)